MKRAFFLIALLLAMAVRAEEPSAPKQEKERVQCQAVTKSGSQCKRRAAEGKRYCRQHASNVKPKKAPARCRAVTDNGRQCDAKPVEGSNYCEKHGDGD